MTVAGNGLAPPYRAELAKQLAFAGSAGYRANQAACRAELVNQLALAGFAGYHAHREGYSYCNASSTLSFAARRAGRIAAISPKTVATIRNSTSCP